MSVEVASATDLIGLASLRREARSDSDAASTEVAQQFESLFIQMMLKAMRDTVPEGGLFDSDQMEAYQQMFDQQLSVEMAQNGGIGLADVIERQLRSPGVSAPADTDPTLARLRLSLQGPEE